MPLLILLLLIAIPAIEIALFIDVGGLIGAWPTVGLTFLTAAGGLALVRYQGLSVLARARLSIEAGDVPVLEVLDGACLVLAGVLLITPGFFTDTFGAALLVPAVRHVIGVVFFSRVWLASRNPVHPSKDGSIDGEFEDLTDGSDGPDPATGQIEPPSSSRP